MVGKSSRSDLRVSGMGTKEPQIQALNLGREVLSDWPHA